MHNYSTKKGIICLLLLGFFNQIFDMEKRLQLREFSESDRWVSMDLNEILTFELGIFVLLLLQSQCSENEQNLWFKSGVIQIWFFQILVILLKYRYIIFMKHYYVINIVLRYLRNIVCGAFKHEKSMRDSFFSSNSSYSMCLIKLTSAVYNSCHRVYITRDDACSGLINNA